MGDSLDDGQLARIRCDLRDSVQSFINRSIASYQSLVTRKYNSNDSLDGNQRSADPLPQKSLPKRRLAPIQHTNERPFLGSVVHVLEDLEVGHRVAVERHGGSVREVGEGTRVEEESRESEGFEMGYES